MISDSISTDCNESLKMILTGTENFWPLTLDGGGDDTVGGSGDVNSNQTRELNLDVLTRSGNEGIEEDETRQDRGHQSSVSQYEGVDGLQNISFQPKKLRNVKYSMRPKRLCLEYADVERLWELSHVLLNDPDEDESYDSKTIRKRVERRFQCEKCVKWFSSKALFDKHLNEDLCRKYLFCPITPKKCKVNLDSRKKLEAHLRTHTSEHKRKRGSKRKCDAKVAARKKTKSSADLDVKRAECSNGNSDEIRGDIASVNNKLQIEPEQGHTDVQKQSHFDKSPIRILGANTSTYITPSTINMESDD